MVINPDHAIPAQTQDRTPRTGTMGAKAPGCRKQTRRPWKRPFGHRTGPRRTTTLGHHRWPLRVHQPTRLLTVPSSPDDWAPMAETATSEKLMSACRFSAKVRQVRDLAVVALIRHQPPSIGFIRPPIAVPDQPQPDRLREPGLPVLPTGFRPRLGVPTWPGSQFESAETQRYLPPRHGRLEPRLKRAVVGGHKLPAPRPVGSEFY